MSSLLYPKQPSKQPIRRLSLTPTQRSMLKLQLRRGGTIPLTSGYLEKDATVIAAAGGAIAGFEWEEKTADFTARVNMGYYVDTALNDVTMTLPSAPAPGTEVAFFVIGDNALNIVSTDLIQGAALLQDWGRQPTETYLIYVFNFVGGSTGWTWDVRYEGRVGAVYLGGMWTPSLISTALWLDASRTESITLESGAVSQWDDLSGNNRHAVQAVVTDRPTYDVGAALLFDGTTDHLITTHILSVTHSVFYIAKRYTQLGTGSILRPVVEASDTGLTASYGARRPPEGTMDFAVGTGRVDPLPTWNVDEQILSTAVFDQSILKAGKNGLFDLSVSVTATSSTASTWIGGGEQVSERRFAGEISEVVILSSVSTNPLRQRIEGYLAHKWGLTDSLPNAHPYKAFPPGVDPDPYIDNVVLYLKGDGSDGSTYITDSSLDPKTITRNGNTQISTAQSKYGGSSIYFDGTDDYLAINENNTDFNLPSDFTVETWVYLTGYSPSNSGAYGVSLLATYNVGATSGWQIRINGTASSYTTVNVYTGTTDLNFAYNFNLNEWYHVVMSRESGILRVFANGTQIGSVANSDAFSGSNSLRMGKLQDIQYLFELKGYLDSARITKGIARYTADFNPETDTYLSYPTVAPPSDPYLDSVVLHLKGDGANDSTNIVDSSPTPKTITRYGNAKISTTESVYGGSSSYFDGSGDYLTIPASTDFAFGTGDFTVEAWLYAESNASTAYGHIFTIGDQNTGITFKYWNTAPGRFYVYSGALGRSIAASIDIIPIGRFIHVAYVRSGNTFIVYCNGIAGASGTESASLGSASATCTVGWSVNPTGEYTKGYIDSLRITKGIARYTNRFNPLTDTYLAY